MKAKLKLKLVDSELRALNEHLKTTLISQAIDELRYYPQDFLICSTIHELYEKTSAKVEDLGLFPTRRTDTVYPLTVSRSQALALFCTILTDDSVSDEQASQTMPMLPMATDTYEHHFLQGLAGRIHQTFLI